MFKATREKVIAVGVVVVIAVIVILVVTLSGSGTPTTPGTTVSPTTLPATATQATGAAGSQLEVAGSGLAASVIAQIGSVSITQAELGHWLVVANNSSQVSTGAAAPPLPVPPDYSACIAGQRAAAANATASSATLKATCAQDYQTLVTEVLTYLIQSVWMQGEATDRGVAVTPAQVATSFQQERKAATPPLTTVAELNSFLAKSGETVADLKWRTDITLLASKIEAKVQAATPAVTSTQIAAYYRAHRAQYVTPVTRNLHLVVTSTLVAANAAKAALAGGSSYAVVAPKYSIDPTSKAAGGKVLGASATALNPPLSAAVFKATPGILSGPLKAGSVYYVFTVDAIIPSSQQSLASASAAVKTLLTQQQTAKAGSTLQSDFTAKWAPRTNCRIGFVVSGAPASTGGAATPVCSKAAISTAVLADTANIVPPPSAAQTLIYTAPTGTTAPTGPTAPTATTTVPAAPAVSTPTSGPLSTEPKITVPKAPAPTTLVKTDLIVGSGAAVAAGDSITVNYVGALYSTGKVFDASWLRHQTFATTIGTGAVIKGWDQGLVGMRVGGRRELIIPSALAYGATVQGAVPANSTLIFIVDLLAVTPGG